MLRELHGTHVIEGRVEPLVVVPPHVPVQVRAQPFHARADVVVHEFLPDETVGGFHHRVVVRAAGPGKGTRDTELGEHALHPFAGEPAAAVRAEHLDVRQGGSAARRTRPARGRCRARLPRNGRRSAGWSGRRAGRRTTMRHRPSRRPGRRPDGCAAHSH